MSCAPIPRACNLRACNRMYTGCYPMPFRWADASRYLSTASLSSNVLDAVRMLRLTLTLTPTRNLSLSLSLTPNQVRMLRGDRARGPAPASWGFSRRWAATSWHLRKPKRDGADLGVGSAYGVVHCPVFDCDKELALYNWRRAVVSAETMLAYDELVGGDETPLDAAGRAFAELRIKNERPGRYAKLRTAPARVWRFLNRTHILASNLLLENTRANRLVVVGSSSSTTDYDLLLLEYCQQAARVGLVCDGARSAPRLLHEPHRGPGRALAPRAEPVAARAQPLRLPGARARLRELLHTHQACEQLPIPHRRGQV